MSGSPTVATRSGAGEIDTVCVVGSGGREHALAVVLGRTADVIVTPGNPGITGVTPEGHTIASVSTPAAEIEADLYVIGPEAPLVDGLADRLRAAGRLVFGPGADGARLEGSKAFMKELLAEAGVPSARYGAFTDPVAAKAYLHTLPGPWVVKTDGLAAGKGVLVTGSRSEAESDIDAKLSGRAFGDAGRQVVVEEGLTGQECSLLVLCDGRRLAALAPAQDFKRLEDHDRGPNTGGMGAYSPVPFVDQASVGRLVDEAVAPLLVALRARNIDYRGVLYAGVMLTSEGPKVLEFNVRFGDPETQVVLPRLEGDLAGLLAEVAAGSLVTVPRFADSAAVCVVLAAAGYPESPRTGDEIDGLDRVSAMEGVTAFHAGTAPAGVAQRTRGKEAHEADGADGADGAGGAATGARPGAVVTSGGRVLGMTALGATLAAARTQAYLGVSAISWPGMQYRSDIASAASGESPVPAALEPQEATR
jgi:phosphoribosylamine---glycine ligase